MGEEQEVFNGIDGSTGRYLPGPESREILNLRPPLSPAQLREYRWWVERHGIDDPNRAPVQDVDPKSIASSGWGVIFAPDIRPEIQEALQPLLNRRRNQAGPFFKSYTYGPNQNKLDFLAEQKAGPGPADPKKVPYYLLIVGDPRTIPFRFQYELDVQYAVGRIFFDDVQDYDNYARSVVNAETANRESLPPQQVTLFGVSNPDDPATASTLHDLIEPLAEVLARDRRDWPVQLIRGQDATKAALSRVLGGGENPALLFTASHGLGYPLDDERLLPNQGALLCQDWPGPQEWGNREIPPEFFFSGDDVGGRSLLGSVIFHFACHSAGSPEISDFSDGALSDPEQIAPFSFLARLPRRLLSHPKGGALAVLGHLDRAWTTSFNWTQEEGSQIEVFESTIKRLLDGHPVGSATEYINQRHAELAVDLSGLLVDRERQLSPSRSLVSRMWRANHDARNFVVVGDPVVRLA